MNLSYFALRNKSLVISILLLFLLWGFNTFLHISRDEEPKFTIRTAIITTTWTGATAEDIENLITDPIEDTISTIDEVMTIRSDSKIGLSRIYVELIEKGLSVDEIDNVWDKLQKKLNDMSDQLPQGSSAPYFERDFGETSAMLLGVFQKAPTENSEKQHKYTPRELELISDRLKDALKRLASVAKVEKFGVEEEAIYIEADIGRWSQLQLTSEDLKNLLQARNIVSPGGTIDTNDIQFSIKPSGELNTVQEIDRIIVGKDERNAPVYLRDLGLKVSRRYREPFTKKARYNDLKHTAPAPTIVLSIIMKEGHNIVKLGEEVKGLLQQGKESFIPKDIEVEILSDVPKQVVQAISALLWNLFQAIILVIAVAFLLIGLRLALVIAAAIPMVMLSAIGIMTLFDVNINTVSIAALIVSLGMLVDNAIEVCDNTHNFLHRGYNRFQAVVQGTQQIAFPIFIATMTTVVAFLPMLTIPGDTGEYIRSLPIVVSITLLFSYFLAMTVTAILAYFLIKPGKSKPPIEYLWKLISVPLKLILWLPAKLVSSKKENSLSLFENLCLFFIKYKLLTFALTAVAFMGACFLVISGRVGTQFFPAALRDQFLIILELPEGSPVHRTNAKAQQLERLLKALSPSTNSKGESIQRLKSSITYIGEGGPRFFMSSEPEPPAANTATIMINTTSPFVVDSLIQDLRYSVAKGIPEEKILPITGARLIIKKLLKGPPIKYPVGIHLLGPDKNQLRTYAKEVKQILQVIPGIHNINDSWGNMAYQLAVEVDEDKANLAGVSNAAVARTLNAFFTGHYLTTFREGDHKVPIYLRLPSTQRGNLELLDRVYVEGNTQKVPLDAIASIHPRWQPAIISRRNQIRSIEVRCQVEEGVLANNIVKEAIPELKKLESRLPQGYYIEVGGEYEESTRSQQHMRYAFSISLVLIIICLMVLYNSFSKTLIVLLAIPLATTGSLVGLFITGKALGFMAMLGLLSLAGIVLNDIIVLIEFIEHEIKAKQKEIATENQKTAKKTYAGLGLQEFREAVARGTKMRILPIILTTLTTVGGLLPLALSGDPLWEPMAITVIFGLLYTTILAFFITPAIYSFFVEYLFMDPVKEREE